MPRKKVQLTNQLSADEKYFEAKDLWHQVADDFYTLENEKPGDRDLMTKIMKDIDKLFDVINEIDISAFKSYKNFNTLKNNIKGYIEDSKFIRKEISKMRDYERAHPNPPEMYSEEGRKNWEEQLKKQREEAQKSKNWEPESEEWDEIEEGFFISLEDYLKEE